MSTDPLVLDPALSERLLAIEYGFCDARLRLFRLSAARPEACLMEPCAGGRLYLCPEVPDSLTNRLIGVRPGPGHEAHIRAGLKRLDDEGMTRCVFLAPALLGPQAHQGRMEHLLLDEGLRPIGHESTLAGPLRACAPAPPDPAGAEIIRVETAEHYEQFLTAYFGGWESAETEDRREIYRRWFREIADWDLFLALVDGVPAAHGIVEYYEGAAYLSDAATVPAYRGRGLQSAIIGRRIDAARRRGGVDLVMGQARCDTPSQRNMIRAGLAIQSIETVWSGPPV